MGNKTTHQLKIEQPYFEAILNDLKLFEVRYNDRDYQVGDILQLTAIREDDKQEGIKNSLKVEVTYMTNYQQKKGYVILGIKKITEPVTT